MGILFQELGSKQMVDLKDIHKYIKHKLMIFISFISDIPINIFIQVYILSIDSLSDSSRC
jgi:hypothetical protein